MAPTNPVPPVHQDRSLPHALEITLHCEDDRLVLSVNGEVDMASVPPLRSCLEHATSDSFEGVVVDLSGVTFLDSSGVNALLQANLRLTAEARNLTVRNPLEAVRRTFVLAGVGQLLEDEAQRTAPAS